MAKTTTETPRYLLMTETREHGYLHVYGRVVTQRHEQGQWQPYGVDDRYSDGPLYSGLRLGCQGDEQSRARAMAGDAGAVYGFSCEYHDVFSVDRRTAVRMAKTLTQLDAKLDKLTEKRGYVQTYGAYVGRVAEALGCVGMGFVRTARSREMTGESWQWDTLGQGVTRIDRQIDAWVDEARPKETEQVA